MIFEFSIFCITIKFTALQRTLKNFGIAARRFRRLTLEEIRILQRPSDYDIYQSELVFSPWLADGEFLELYSIVSPYTLVGNVRCHVLYTSFLQALHCKGEVWDSGIYKGGTALMFKSYLGCILLQNSYVFLTLLRACRR